MNYKLFSVLLTTICLSSYKTKLHSVQEMYKQSQFIYKSIKYHSRSLYWSHIPWVVEINLCSPQYNLLCRPLRKNMPCLDYYNTPKWHVFLASALVSREAFCSLLVFQLVGYESRCWLQQRPENCPGSGLPTFELKGSRASSRPLTMQQKATLSQECFKLYLKIIFNL